MTLWSKGRKYLSLISADLKTCALCCFTTTLLPLLLLQSIQMALGSSCSPGAVGWGQNLEFYVPQSTGSLRIIGEILECCNQLQNIHRAMQFLNTYIIESDPKAMLDVCFLLHNVGFITVLKGLTFSHPRFLSALEKALCYCSRSLWYWENGTVAFLGNFFLWVTLNLFYLLQNNLQGKWW